MNNQLAKTELQKSSSWLAQFRTFDLVAILTLALSIYLTFESQNFFQFLILLQLLVVSIAWPAFRRSCHLWLTVVLLWVPTLYYEWCNHEDHVYFAIYWCAVLGLATWRPAVVVAGKLRQRSDSKEWHRDTEKFIRVSARWLIGLCFLFAFAWKLASPEFRDGSLFQYKLTCDNRFSETLAIYPGGMDVPTLLVNYEKMHELRSPAAQVTAQPLQYTDRISWMSHAMTWWTILIEGLLAVAFLWPAGRRVNLVRNASLILFALSTYVIAPVMGYGFAFMILGFANTESHERKTRWTYFGALIILLLILLYRDNFVPPDIKEAVTA
ncbi:MAG: hypothetical protein ACR2NP_17720 [Pirellulaceae bacterium]